MGPGTALPRYSCPAEIEVSAIFAAVQKYMYIRFFWLYNLNTLKCSYNTFFQVPASSESTNKKDRLKERRHPTSKATQQGKVSLRKVYLQYGALSILATSFFEQSYLFTDESLDIPDDRFEYIVHFVPKLIINNAER